MAVCLSSQPGRVTIGNCYIVSVVLVTLLFVSLSSASSADAESDAELLRILPRVKRLIGGSEVQVGDWPWLVHLTGKIPEKVIKIWWGKEIPITYRYYNCGGSIVDKRWIMTAAHCFTQPNANHRILRPKHWHIKAGEVDRKHTVIDNVRDIVGRVFDHDDWKMWYLHAEKIVLHPSYNARESWKNDIALIKLEKDLPIGPDDPNIGITSLPSTSDMEWPAVGTLCIMKGWGCTAKGGSLSSTAQAVELPAEDEDVCKQYFGPISSTRLCAGYSMEQKGLCGGDSGGPLVCKNGDEWMQAGIASFTSASKPGDVPGVFTRVAYYRDWIADTLRRY